MVMPSLRHVSEHLPFLTATVTSRTATPYTVLGVSVSRKMALKRRNLNVALWKLLALASLILFTFLVGRSWRTPRRKKLTQKQQWQQLHLTVIGTEHYLQFVPDGVAERWAKANYLVVLGIPSIDDKERSARRALQRTYCWTYGGVATKSNNFVGNMLPLYLLSAHEDNDFRLSRAVRAEAHRNRDVIVLPTFDVRSTSGKVLGELKSWGREVEAVMSRKTYLWLKFATQFFRNASYITKADDDLFIRVPHYLHILKTMPRRGLNMGWYGQTPEVFIDRWVPFVAGYCLTLSLDVAQAVVDYEPLQQLVNMPYTEGNSKEFYEIAMFNEDVMVATVLRERVKYDSLVTVDIGRCRYISHFYRKVSEVVTDMTIVVHHIKEEDYSYLRNRFPETSAPPLNTSVWWRDGALGALNCSAAPRRP